MSVLKAKRTVSKAEFVNTANQIYVETLNFLTRMSARYARLLAEPVAKLAGEVVDHCEKANSIFPSDEQRINLRKAHLLEARASLKALDVRLTHCYNVLILLCMSVARSDQSMHRTLKIGKSIRSKLIRFCPRCTRPV